MTLLTPLGLIALVGIIALIILYILRPKYKSQKVSSTFVWKLSLRYKRKKNPFEWLQQSILMILQILLIGILAFSLAQPLITRAAQTDTQTDTIIIIDASASMLATDGGVTRFDIALNQIRTLANEASDDRRISVVIADREARILVGNSDSPDFVRQSLIGASATFGNGDISGAIGLANGLVADGRQADVILFTSRPHPGLDNVTVVDVSRGEWNAAILDLSVSRSGGFYLFRAEVASFNYNRTLTVVLNIDGDFRAVETVQAYNNETVAVYFHGANIVRYNFAEAFIDLEEGENDSFAYDNSFFHFGGGRSDINVHIVSRTPFFFNAMLSAMQANVSVATPRFGYGEEPSTLTISDFNYSLEGYDLYIFDRLTPATLPTDGASLLVAPTSSPMGVNLTFGSINTIATGSSLTANPILSAAARSMLESVDASEIVIRRYQNIILSPGFEQVMLVGNNPAMLLRVPDIGYKTAILTFDLAYSTLPMQASFAALLHNLVSFSFPSTLERLVFNVGDQVILAPRTTAESVEIYIEGGQTISFYRHLDAGTNGEFTPTIPYLTTAGTYVVTQRLANGDELIESFFVRVPRLQSEFTRAGDAGGGIDDGNNIFGPLADYIDIIFWILLVAFVLLFLEWWLQYREQF